jgi:L-malate glycosyltransferase
VYILSFGNAQNTEKCVNCQYFIYLLEQIFGLYLANGNYSVFMLKLCYHIRQERLPLQLVSEQSAAYYDYLNLADGFVLTSREDPFPLVMIEAAWLGKPIVAFNSGGVSEFVQPGMGTVVNSMWPADLAAAMTDVMTGQTPIHLETLKSRAAQFDVNTFTESWLKLFAPAE